MKEKLEELQNKIPSFECEKGCSMCCGPITFSKYEWDKVKDKRMAKSIHCPYIGKKGCDIYKDRPLLCRLFGTVPEMVCPVGKRPKKMLDSEEGRFIIIKYYELFL